MHVGLDDERNASREEARRRRDLSRHSHHRHGRCFRESRRTGAPTSKCARLADVANSGADTTRRSARARDKTVLTKIQKADSAYDKFQRDAKSVIAKYMECSTTQGEKLDQELMSLEMLALKCDPLSDENVLRAASTANELAELVEDARALASALRNLFKLKMGTQAWPLACRNNNKNSEILNFGIQNFGIQSSKNPVKHTFSTLF